MPQIPARNQAGPPETGLYRVPPHLGTAGKGGGRQRPHLGGGGQGNGVHGNVARQVPHLGTWVTGINNLATVDTSRRAFLTAYMRQLTAPLERVRVCFGDWTRGTGPRVTRPFSPLPAHRTLLDLRMPLLV